MKDGFHITEFPINQPTIEERRWTKRLIPVCIAILLIVAIKDGQDQQTTLREQEQLRQELSK